MQSFLWLLFRHFQAHPPAGSNIMQSKKYIDFLFIPFKDMINLKLYRIYRSAVKGFPGLDTSPGTAKISI
jgi:hypothetical protein